MTWWTGQMLIMLRELAVGRPASLGVAARRGLSSRQIAWKINVTFGTWFTADAVRRQAAARGIKLHGKSGPPKGNTNAQFADRRRNRDEQGRFTNQRNCSGAEGRLRSDREVPWLGDEPAMRGAAPAGQSD